MYKETIFLFTYHIVNIKQVSFNKSGGTAGKFTYHIVNIKQGTQTLIVKALAYLHIT